MPLNFTAGTYGHTRPHPENRDLTSEIVRVLWLFELPMSSRFCRDTLWWTNIAMERSTIFNGKIHYKWPFSIAMLVHQRVSTLSTIPGSSSGNVFSKAPGQRLAKRWYVQFRPIVPVDLQPPSTWAVSHGSAQLHPRVKPWCFTSGFVGRKSSDLVLPWIQASPSNIILLPWAVERFMVNWPVVSRCFHWFPLVPTLGLGDLWICQQRDSRFVSWFYMSASGLGDEQCE